MANTKFKEFAPTMQNVFLLKFNQKRNFWPMKFLQIFDVCFRHFPIFVLCYIHPKLAALKIFYSSQKHVIISYTGLPKKNGFKSKLWIKKFITISEIAIEHSIACYDALFVRNLNTSRAKNLKSYKNRLETESLRFLFHILHEMLFHYFWRLFLKDALFKFCR